MDEQSKQALALFEEALVDGWINREEYRAIAREAARAATPEGAEWLWQQMMEALQRKAPDEASKRLIILVQKLARLAPGAKQPPRAVLPQSRVYFTPGFECHDALLQSLAQARESLDICVFTITDDTIAEEIFNASRRKVTVRIITDDEKAKDWGSDVYRLAGVGLDIRADDSVDHMHHKFAIVDQRTVVTGSLNWTSGSVQNFENVIISSDTSVVKAYIEEFDRLWDIMKPVQPGGHHIV